MPTLPDPSMVTPDLFHDAAERWKDEQANREKLDGCKRHLFLCQPPLDNLRVVGFSMRLQCENCQGKIGLSELLGYIRGYEAAGQNGNDIWPGWR